MVTSAPGSGTGCAMGQGLGRLARSRRVWDWVADGGPPVCPRVLVPQLLKVAARADAELLRALWERPF